MRLHCLGDRLRRALPHADLTNEKALWAKFMWVEIKKVPNLMTAEMWKEVFEGEGLPTRILPEGDILDWGERVPFRVMVPRGREHVAEEILRKL